MSDRESLGSIRVSAVGIVDVNNALRQVTERIDQLKGLRGRSLIYDRVRVDDPTEEDDALNTPLGASALPAHVLFDNVAATISAVFTFTTSIVASAGVLMDGVDVSVHAAGSAMAQHGGGTGTHTHQSAGAEGGTLDHGAALTGLTDDDHTNYVLLAGRTGGQTVNGGSAASDSLTLKSTANNAKGAVRITDLSPFTWSDVNGTVLHQFGT